MLSLYPCLEEASLLKQLRDEGLLFMALTEINDFNDRCF